MDLKKSGLLLVAFVGVLSLWQLGQSVMDRPTKLPADLDWLSVSANQVEQLVITRPTETTQLVKTEETGWMVDGFPVSEGRLQTALSMMNRVSEYKLVSKKIEKHALYQVSTADTKIEVDLGNHGEKLIFYAGKQGPVFESTYVRLPDDPSVFLVDQNLRSQFGVPQSVWYDRTVIDIPSDTVTKIEIRDGKTLMLLQKEGESWKQVRPKVATASLTAVSGYLRTSTRFLGSDIRLNESLEQLKSSGVFNTQKRVLLTDSSGQTHTLLVGKGKDGSYTVMQKERDDYLFTVQESVIKHLFPKPDSLVVPPDS